jgi:hypothetical protein
MSSTNRVAYIVSAQLIKVNTAALSVASVHTSYPDSLASSFQQEAVIRCPQSHKGAWSA